LTREKLDLIHANGQTNQGEKQTMQPLLKILDVFAELSGNPVSKTMDAIVKGTRRNAPDSIDRMNRRIREVSNASPWAGNRPGVLASNAYLEWVGYLDYFDE
jgi:hypothetical protein